MAEKKPNPHAGHRQRMKEEFLRTGAANMADHRLLELILFFSIPQGDVNPLAHDLLDRFGTLAGVLQAPYERLLTVPGVGPNTAMLLNLSYKGKRELVAAVDKPVCAVDIEIHDKRIGGKRSLVALGGIQRKIADKDLTKLRIGNVSFHHIVDTLHLITGGQYEVLIGSRQSVQGRSIGHIMHQPEKRREIISLGRETGG